MNKYIILLSLFAVTACKDKATLEDIRKEAKAVDEKAVAISAEMESIDDSLSVYAPLSNSSEEATEKALDLQAKYDSLEQILRGYEEQLNNFEALCQKEYDTYCL